MKKKKKKEKKELNLNLFKYLDNEIFWGKFRAVCLSRTRFATMRTMRIRRNIPTKKVLIDFIEQDFRFLQKDERETNDIILDLLSESIIFDNI